MWGKVLGALFGLALLKVPGLFLGVLLGHLVDQWFARRAIVWSDFSASQGSEDEQALFMYSSFAIMGHLAKATGVVTKAHIEQANHFMQQLRLTGRQQKEAQDAFRDGKAVNFPFRAQIAEFYQCYRKRPDVLQLFLEIQLSTVCTGGRITPEQQDLLWQMADILRISRSTLEQLLQAYQARQGNDRSAASNSQTLAAAYQVLGCKADVSDYELKRSYRKLMAQHHPDKLISQGVPEAMLDVAKKRSQDIQAAYETIKQQRAKNR
ncbi:co-chaperone DjlA [Alishewanella jeotgali]|nr:co-chaperone DjlA [Alishewanella jeotgali]